MPWDKISWEKNAVLRGGVGFFVAAGTTLVTNVFGFLQPPPPLQYGDPHDQFWVGLSIVCSGVICAMLLALRNKSNVAKAKPTIGISAVILLIIFARLSIDYNHCRLKWTFPYRGETVLIGDTYTESAKIDLQNSPDRTASELLLDFKQHSDRVWTIDGLRRKQEQLGVRLLLANVAGAICLSLAEWFAVPPPGTRSRRSRAKTSK